MYRVLRTGLVGRCGALLLAFGVAACGMKQDQLDNQLAQLSDELRTEMQAGDQQVADGANRRIDETNARVGQLANDLQALSSELQSAVTRMEARLHVDMPVHFGFDESTIRESDKPALDRFATVIREHHPNVLITVEGFADPAGDEQYNQWLGLQRANAVRQYLVESGRLDASKVKAVSYGEASNRQVKPGAWGDNGIENRRVALVIDFVGE